MQCCIIQHSTVSCEQMANDRTRPHTISAAIGRRLEEVRRSAGASQEEFAALAHSIGLPWSRNVVNAVEKGTREVAFGEAVLLAICITALLNQRKKFQLVDFLPHDDTTLVLAGSEDEALVLWRASAVRKALKGHVGAITSDDLAADTDWPRVPADVIAAATDVRDARPAAEHRAASHLGVTVGALVDAALDLWGAPFVAERDRRVSERLPRTAGLTSRRTLRGHVTRELVEELRAHLNEGGAK
jgi:transcriptional regulator with XRE-family HTH domain